MAFDLIGRVETMYRPKVVVVGDLILDRYIWAETVRISQEAPVPLLRDRRDIAPSRSKHDTEINLKRAIVFRLTGTGSDVYCSADALTSKPLRED